ncbi:hypothetical protein TURU_002294 [Turdus rufiventris]|nr:hypothetical protein TURU_002294 [Turdus rufiventris]
MAVRGSAARWCFTLNNPSEEEIRGVQSVPHADCHYAIVGKEVWEQGTPHLQGFLHMKKKQRLSALKKLIPRAHWDKAHGSDEDNENYWSKEGNVILTIGIPVKGNRSDLAGSVAAVAEVSREFSEVYVKCGR